MKEKRNYSTLDESILVEHSKSGDTQSFEELVSRYRDRVYARAFSIMRNEDLAIDLSQNAWIKAWQPRAIPWRCKFCNMVKSYYYELVS